MAATKLTAVLLNCLSCSRKSNRFLGVFTQNFSDARASIVRKSLRAQSCHGAKQMIARTMCSSQSALNVVDTDEKVEIPQAADSHMTSSMFDNEVVNKFVNCMMWDGKKSLSQKIFKLAMEEIKKEQLKKQRQSSQPDFIETDPLQIFLNAIENSKPIIGVRAMKKGGNVYQVPTPINQRRRRFLAIKWLITAARERQKGNARMYKKLATELLDAYNNEGTVINKKHELHKRAEDNRAYAHYRWW